MSYFLDPGEMDRPIEILEKTTTTNAYNEEEETWTTADTIFARRRDMSGSEGMDGGQIVASTKVEWTLYYYDGLNAKDHRIKDEDDNVYDIISRPREKGFKEFMEVDTVVRDNGTA